jgi:hypothetical protein
MGLKELISMGPQAIYLISIEINPKDLRMAMTIPGDATQLSGKMGRMLSMLSRSFRPIMATYAAIPYAESKKS